MLVSQIPEKIVQRAVAAIKRQQKPDFTYLYGENYLKNMPMRGINRPGGSLGRSQSLQCSRSACGNEGIASDNVLKAWLYRLYLRNGWLDIGRNDQFRMNHGCRSPDTSITTATTMQDFVIDQLQPEDRNTYRNLLAKILIKHQEPDGCWWDYTLYNYYKQYGTAYALMSMQRCLPE